jgi:hypothetical protein
LKAIDETSGQLTYQQWRQRLATLIAAFPQHPQLEGRAANKRRVLFT